MNPSITGSNPGRLISFLPKLDRRQFKRSVIFFPVLIVIFIKRFIYAPTILRSPLLSHIMGRQLHGKKKKQIAQYVLEICKSEKRYGELFIPLTQAVARASMLTGVSIYSLQRFKAQSHAEKVLTRLQWTTLTDALFGER